MILVMHSTTLAPIVSFILMLIPEISHANQAWRIGPSTGNKAAIYPGTKWCGLGDIALHSEDLGRYHETDRCCRDHDKCLDVIKSGSCKYGLCNNSPFTASNCDCDESFRDCLLKARDPASLPVGKIFFDIAAISCIRFIQLNERQDNGAQGIWRFERPRPFIKQGIYSTGRTLWPKS